jgi:aldehyde dehydrogenase (NAD+)
MASASNMKRTWCPSPATDWFDETDGEGLEFLREAVQVKNIWIPYGE